MVRKLSAIIMALVFAVSLSGMAVAKSVTCTVETIEEGKVVLDCGKKADKLTVDTKVKVKTVKARKAVEGCQHLLTTTKKAHLRDGLSMQVGFFYS